MYGLRICWLFVLILDLQTSWLILFCTFSFVHFSFVLTDLLQLMGNKHMAESRTGPSAAEASSSSEEGTSSIFSDCPPVEKKKEQWL